jgi:hypothetical protein
MAGEAYKEVNIGKEMCDALEQQYRGNIASAKANVRVYLENPAGIGEHPDVVQALDTQIAIIAENQEKLDILNSRAFNFPGDRYPVE